MSLELGNHVVFVVPLNIGFQKSNAVEDYLLVKKGVLLCDQLGPANLDKISLNLELVLDVLSSDKEQWHVTEAPSAHLFDILILAVNSYLPEGVESLQLAVVVNQHNILVIVKLERTFLLVHNMEQVWEALVCLQVQVNAVHWRLVAHDFCKHLETQFVVKQVHALSRSRILVLPCQKVEELSGLNFEDSFCDKYLEHFLDVVEL